MSDSRLTDEQIREWVNLKGNLSLSPTYIDLVRGLWNVVSWYYKPSMWTNYRFPQTFLNDFTQHFYFPLYQVSYILYLAIFITILRYLFEQWICKPFLANLQITSLNKKKLPEAAWKCLFYTCTWSYSVYLLHYCYNYFRDPYSIWDDWSQGMPVSFDIQLMYFVQCGFYLHSVYGTIFMDYKRKDFYVMLLHHFLTMTLIFVSYATRYHKIGLLVLFVHDITDIWLELTKLLHYLASRSNGEQNQYWETAASACFVVFTFCWFLFRLYWFPLKVLYSAGVASAYRAYDKGCGLYGFFNVLLWLLLGLNLYWLIFILQFLLRFVTGRLNNLHDVREDEEEEEEEEAKSSSTSIDQTVTNNEKKKNL